MNPIRTPEKETLDARSAGADPLASPMPTHAELDAFYEHFDLSDEEETSEQTYHLKNEYELRGETQLAFALRGARHSAARLLDVGQERARKNRPQLGMTEAAEVRMLLSATTVPEAQAALQSLLDHPETVTETTEKEVTLSYAGQQTGVLAEQSVLTLQDGVKVQLWTSDNKGITSANGAMSSRADGKDHVIQKFVNGPVFVSVVQMKNLSGTTGGKINLSLGDTNYYVDLPASGKVVLPTPVKADTISFLALSGRGAGFEAFSIKTQVKETRETDSYTSKVAEARALLSSLESTTVVQGPIAPTTITFAGLKPGNLDASLSSSGATVALPVLGSIKVGSGGFTPMRVTETGGLQTGVNSGHMTLQFDTPTFVESLTVKQSGTGKRLYNLGDGYKEMNGLTEIAIGAKLNELTFIVYGDAEVEIVSINLPHKEELAQTQMKEIVVDMPKNVALPLLSERSGHTEMRSTNWSDVLAAPAQNAYFSDLQAMSQWWAPGGQFIGMRSVLSFQAPTVADGLRIASATLVFTGTSKLSTTGAPLSLHAVAEGMGSVGSIDYENFVIGENRMELNPALLYGQEGAIRIDLKTSMDLLNQAPPKSGNNAYTFSLGKATAGDNAPKLLLTYETIPAGEKAPSNADILSQKALSSVAFAGSTAMVRVRQDIASGTIAFEGQKHVNTVLSSTECRATDGQPTFASVTLDGANETGIYDIVIRDNKGVELSRTSVHWNKETKTLSLPEGQTPYVPSDEEKPLLNDATELLALCNADLGAGDKRFATTQHVILLDAVQAFLGMQDFQTAFNRAHPEWAGDAINAKALADSQTSKFSYGQIYQGLLNQKFDTMGILRQDYARYEWMMGDYMKQAMSILAKMRSGTPQRDLVKDLSDSMYRDSHSLVMNRLASIGIRFPHVDALLQAGAQVGMDVMKEMLRVKEDERQELLKEQGGMNSPTYAGGGLSEEQKAAQADKQAHLRNMKIISVSEGTGDPITRAWIYGLMNGLTKEEMKVALGVTTERVASLSSVMDGIIGGIRNEAMKIISPEGDILTPMTTDSLTRIKNNATKALASAITRNDEDNIAFFTAQLEAADGLLALIPAGETVPSIALDNIKALAWKELIERTTSDPLRIPVPDGTDFMNPVRLTLAPGTSKTIEWVLTEEKMVNFGLPGDFRRNITLEIGGGALGATVYRSEHQQGSGDSVSLRLPAGTYNLTLRSIGSYMLTDHTVTVNTQIKPYNSANIEGMISIEGSPKVMPVRMRVVNFKANGSRNTDYDKPFAQGGVKELNTDQPVWVVVPGRNDRDDSAKMIELEKALTQSGYQVVTIDWREASKSFAGVQGEQWIQAVGDWGFRALVSAGIDGSNIRMGVHSWGSWVGNVIAEHYQKENGFGVDTIVAMDSAIDPTLSYYYDASSANFSNVSKNSVAFWSSGFGSQGRAHTAEHTVELRSPSLSATPIYNQVLKHGMAVTTVANLVRLKNIDPTNAIASRFAWSSNEYDGLPIHEGTDAWMHVDAYSEFYQNGSTEEEYIDAIPTRMSFGNPDDEVEDLFLYNEIRNLQ